MSDVGQGEIEGSQSRLTRIQLQWQIQEYVLEGKYLSDLKTSSVRSPEWWVGGVGGMRRKHRVQQGR